MYDLYLEKYEQDQHMRKAEGRSYTPLVTYDFYYRFFHANISYAFGSPRTDTCRTCDTLVNRMNTSTSDEEKQTIATEKELHLRKSEVFYNDMKEKSAEARENASVETLCIDYQQNMPLPKVPSTDAFYSRQVWVYNFCVYGAKKKTAHFYMYDESTGKKGANEVISFLNHYFENILSGNIKHLYLFSDNCCAQNKNTALVQFLFTCANIGRFETITHRFPEPGHSFMPCDRCFGLIEKNTRRTERIFLPQEYEKLVKKTSPLKFNVISVKTSMIRDFVCYLKINSKR